MNTEVIPKGWTRGACIQFRSKESQETKGIVAVIWPCHKVPADAAKDVRFKTVAEYEEWRKWWFSGPLCDPSINDSWQHEEDKKMYRMVNAGSFAAFPPNTDVTAAPQAPKPAANPFAKPQKPADNPFAKPKPKNPFDT
jgi:hypothetical protein